MAEEAKETHESAVGQNRPGDPLRKRKGRTNQTVGQGGAAPDDRRRTKRPSTVPPSVFGTNCPNKPAHTKPHGRTFRGCGRLHENLRPNSPPHAPCFSNGFSRRLPAQSIRRRHAMSDKKNFAILKSLLYLCTAFERRIELWCNGNTSDFGSEILGSSPDSSTKMRINEFLFIRIYSFPIEPDRSAS